MLTSNVASLFGPDFSLLSQTYDFFCIIVFAIAALTVLTLAGIGVLGYYMSKGRDGPKLKLLANVLQLVADIMFSVLFLAIMSERFV